MFIILLIIAVGIIGYFAWKNPDFRAKIALVFAAVAAAGAALWDQISALWS